MVEVTTRMLFAGSCRHPQRMTISGGSLRPTDYAALPVLIDHPHAGPMLFDTGYDPAFFTATQPFPERFYRWLTPTHLATGQDVASQCRSLGLRAEDIRHVILSHLHADHMAGLHAFPNAKVHCAAAGYQAAISASRWGGVRHGILRALFPDDLSQRVAFYEDGRRIDLPGELAPFTHGVDLLGDGSVIAIELPGHSAGHWGVLLADAAHGWHFLIGDAAWSLEAVRDNRPPPAITTAFMGQTQRVRATLTMLHDLSLAAPAVRITPFHCPERAAEVLPL